MVVFSVLFERLFEFVLFVIVVLVERFRAWILIGLFVLFGLDVFIIVMVFSL